MSTIDQQRFLARAKSVLEDSSSSSNPKALSQLDLCLKSLAPRNDDPSLKKVRKKLLARQHEISSSTFSPSNDIISPSDVDNEKGKRDDKDSSIHKSDSHTSKNKTAASTDHVKWSANDVALMEKDEVSLQANLANAPINSKKDTASANKVMNLLQQSRDISSQEVESERMVHSQLLSHLSEMVEGLKSSTLAMNQLVVDQNANLESIQMHASENVEELEKQKERMKETVNKMDLSFWQIVITIVWLLVAFTATYIIIRIFPAPR